jgi:hypothetical protein
MTEFTILTLQEWKRELSQSGRVFTSNVQPLRSNLFSFFIYSFFIILCTAFYTVMSTPGKAVKTASSKSSFLDKAVRYLLDTDSTPDRCPDDIWLLGVLHPGYSAESVADAETQGQDPSLHWPPQFYSDFRSRVWSLVPYK